LALEAPDEAIRARQFSIRIFEPGGYQNGGALIGGNVKVH
jgi:hypothetical protein